MPTTPQIIDESGDRKYFTIVPNYVVNHSTIWEQGVYLVMKRIAGEGGKCFASQKEIAKKLSISQPSVSETIQKLVKRGWVKQEGFAAGKTRPVKCWRIVDLWKMNIDHYEAPKQEIGKLGDISLGEDSVTRRYKIDKPGDKEEEHIEEEYINNSEASEDAILEDLIKGTKSVTQEFQYLALEIIDILKVPQKDCASCFKVAKTFDKAQIMTSLSFARDYPNPELKWKMFLWKLHQLRKEGKNAKSGSDHGE